MIKKLLLNSFFQTIVPERTFEDENLKSYDLEEEEEESCKDLYCNEQFNEPDYYSHSIFDNNRDETKEGFVNISCSQYDFSAPNCNLDLESENYRDKLRHSENPILYKPDTSGSEFNNNYKPYTYSDSANPLLGLNTGYNKESERYVEGQSVWALRNCRFGKHSEEELHHR